MVWVWLSLLLGVCVEANSNGVGIPCEVDNPNLGSNDRINKNPNRTMWWVSPPVFAGNQYTLRTADPSSASDPKTYTPGQWMNIFVRTTYQDQQFTGIILYASNTANMKVGKWQVPFGAPFHVQPTVECVVHSNADPKNYLSVFKFQGPPAGSGTVTIKALVKFGLAFPNPTGTFFWPNSAHITLTEKGATAPRVWYEGAVGESCVQACVKNGLGCDVATMQAQGNSPAILDKAGMFSNCSGPVMPGCSAASPSVGTAGCFYHSDTCISPPAETMWVRNDLCANISAYSSSVQYQAKACVVYKSGKWCTAYGASGQAPDASSDPYSTWGALSDGGGYRGACMPAGGYPAGQSSVPVPTRTKLNPTAITCDARKNSPLDGQRICACSTNGQRVANSASQAALSLAVLVVLSLVA